MISLKVQYLRQISGFIIFGILAGFTAISLANSFESRNVTYLLILTLCFFTFFPVFQRLVRRSFDVAEPAVWFVFYFFIHFGVRAISILIFGSPILGISSGAWDLGSINAALSVAIFSILMFWIGYHLNIWNVVLRFLPTLPRFWSETRALVGVFFCLILGWGMRFYLMYSQGGGITGWLAADKYVLFTKEGLGYITFLSNVAYIGLLMVFIMALIYRKQKYWILFASCLVPESIYRFYGGSRAQFVFLLMELLIIQYMSSKRTFAESIRCLHRMVFVGLCGFFLYPFFSVMRGGVQNLSVVFLKTISLWRAVPQVFEMIMIRQHGLDSLALVVEKVPRIEPYSFGSEILFPLIAWIPRSFWPDKPTVSLGRIFYSKFYPPIFHEGTAVAVTIPAELYWALGFIGVTCGMLCIGVVWRCLFEYVVRPRGNVSNILLVGSMFPSFFVVVEQSLDFLLTMHFLQFITLVFICLLIGGRSKI